MKIAILFWFYQGLEICENHLLLLKEFNPGLDIFGLFGGKHIESRQYQSSLGNYLDNFYTSPYTDSHWKWKHGDLVILDWFANRGKCLEWDTVIVVQWDMLVFDSLLRQLPDLQQDQIFLSGMRELDAEVEANWSWTQPGCNDREDYLRFVSYIKERYHYSQLPLCCLFILQALPRAFFEAYAQVSDKGIGFLEYKIPTYAKIFNIPFYKKDLGVLWFEDKELPLNAIPKEISEAYIQQELKKEEGWRIFHPYYKVWR